MSERTIRILSDQRSLPKNGSQILHTMASCIEVGILFDLFMAQPGKGVSELLIDFRRVVDYRRLFDSRLVVDIFIVSVRGFLFVDWGTHSGGWGECWGVNVLHNTALYNGASSVEVGVEADHCGFTRPPSSVLPSLTSSENGAR